MAQRLRVMVALPENHGLIPSTTWWFETTVIPILGHPSLSCGLCRYQACTWCPDIHAGKCLYT